MIDLDKLQNIIFDKKHKQVNNTPQPPPLQKKKKKNTYFDFAILNSLLQGNVTRMLLSFVTSNGSDASYPRLVMFGEARVRKFSIPPSIEIDVCLLP